MLVFTAAEVRRDMPGLYNAVQDKKVVCVSHRDRPEMIMMRRDMFDELMRGIEDMKKERLGA